MAEGGKEDTQVNHPQQPLPFLEVLCTTSGKIRRFSAGTDAGFAVSRINKKLLIDSGGNGDGDGLVASHIEAVKEGEEPVSFGPTSLLVDYGSNWKLQTCIESHGDNRGPRIRTTRLRKASFDGISDDSHSMKRTQSPISLLYIAKILFAFLLLFLFGAVFTLALENLPQIIENAKMLLDHNFPRI